MQSDKTSSNKTSSNMTSRNEKLHVGIIMDGNGRWATRRGLSRVRGHEAGVETIRRIVEAAPKQGIGTLTLYAFSADNWRRPKTEVAALMTLLRFYLASEVQSLVKNGVRLSVIGRRDRLPDGIAAAIARAEEATADGRTLHVRIAVDYSAREAILNAARRLDRDRNDQSLGISIRQRAQQHGIHYAEDGRVRANA